MWEPVLPSIYPHNVTPGIFIQVHIKYFNKDVRSLAGHLLSSHTRDYGLFGWEKKNLLLVFCSWTFPEHTTLSFKLICKNYLPLPCGPHGRCGQDVGIAVPPSEWLPLSVSQHVLQLEGAWATFQSAGVVWKDQKKIKYRGYICTDNIGQRLFECLLIAYPLNY